MGSRSIKIVIAVLLFVTCLGTSATPVTRAQPPLGVFIGQQITYQWNMTANARGLFPEYDEQIDVSATILHTVQSVTAENHSAAVSVEGTIQWPASSIDRHVYRRITDYSVELGWNTQWEDLGAIDVFELQYVATIHHSGRVRELNGSNAISTVCRYPGENSSFEAYYYFDYPAARSLFFIDEVNAEIGSYVILWSIWGGQWSGTVQGFETISTPMMSRQAIRIETEHNGFDPFQFNISLNAVFHYDCQTGFLLKQSHVHLIDYYSYHELTGLLNRTSSIELVATNMFAPRLEQILPWLLVIIIPVSVLVLGILVYRRLGKEY